MSLTLIAQLASETDLLAAVGADASLAFDAWLEPDALARLDVAGPNVVVTLGPYIEVVTTGGGGLVLTTAEAVTANALLAVNPAGLAVLADASNLAHALTIVGLAATDAALGAPVPVLLDGPVYDADWSWSDGPVYAGVGGALTQSLAGLAFANTIGRGDGARLVLSLQPPLLLN